MMQQTPAVGSSREQARAAWDILPHGGRDSIRLKVQCARGHHLAVIYDTSAGLVYAARVRARSHGSRDRVDEPHGGHEIERWLDLLIVADDRSADDAVPAWCDCGHRTFSREALRRWVSEDERRIVVD